MEIVIVMLMVVVVVILVAVMMIQTESTKVAGSCWSLVIPPPSGMIRDPSGMIAVLLVISPDHHHQIYVDRMII